MDQVKIGKFIASCRKNAGYTQMQLAQMLGITDRAVSKWETGKAMPDTSLMLMLCDALKITVNDLLHGEVVTMEEYKEKADRLLLEMVKQKEAADKKLLALEILIGMLSTIILLGFSMVAAYFPMEDWLRAVLVITGFVIGIIGMCYALRIEQTAGYYVCGNCAHNYVPSYNSVLWAMHFGRTRFMKCPRCGKWTWQKKVVRKED